MYTGTTPKQFILQKRINNAETLLQNKQYNIKEIAQIIGYDNPLYFSRIFQSMSRKGNCHDNSVMENFFGLLKQEIYYGVVYYSFEELKSEIERYIKYYNEQRIKEKLGWMSPVQYRLSLLAGEYPKVCVNLQTDVR